MKKICILMPSFGMGGAEKVGLNLANYFASIGLDVDLVVATGAGALRNSILSHVNVVDLNVSRARYSIFSLRKYFKREKPRLVLSVIRRMNIYAGIACVALRDAPDLYFREASPLRDLAKSGPFRTSMFSSLMKFAYKRAKRVISNSELTKSDLINYGIIGENKLDVISNPVLPLDINSLIDAEVTHPWLNDPSIHVILNVGRLYREKNHKVLIDIFGIISKQDEKARLLILGEGPEKARLLNRINKLGIADKVELHDFVENPFPYYRMSRVFVLTSEWEGFGNVIVEALSAGISVVCSDCPGGPRQILENGKYGRLVRPENIQETADAVLDALGNPPNKQELIQRAQEFTVSKIGNKYAEVMGLKWNDRLDL